jgi:hypothetical protein
LAGEILTKISRRCGGSFVLALVSAINERNTSCFLSVIHFHV